MINFDQEKLTSDKPVLVFNYGLVCNVEHWKHQLEYFDKLGFPIVFHDYRFHFKSGSTGTIRDCRFDFMVQDIEELCDHLNLNSVVMLGHSMGVNICLEFAYQLPSRCQALVLISGTVLPPQGIMFETNYMEFISPILQTLLERFPTPFQMIWKTGYQNPLATYLTHKGGFNVEKTPVEFVKTYLQRIGELKPELFFQLLEEMRNHKIINVLEEIKCPCLVMGGDKDSVIPFFLQETLESKLPNSDLYMIKDGSHVPQVDFPDSTNERILAFLDDL